MATIKAGDLAALKSLVASGKVSVNGKRDRTYLNLAAGYGHLEMVRYLVEEAGADPRLQSDQGVTPLDMAVCAGDLEIVRYLIEEQGMDPTDNNLRVGLKGHELFKDGRIEPLLTTGLQRAAPCLLEPSCSCRRVPVGQYPDRPAGEGQGRGSCPGAGPAAFTRGRGIRPGPAHPRGDPPQGTPVTRLAWPSRQGAATDADFL